MTFTLLMQTFLLGLAGSCGAMSRFFISRLASIYWGTGFPWGTLLINVGGALAIGVAAGLVTNGLLDTQVQQIVTTGFLGGFTTFSTMCWESWTLFQQGKYIKSGLYLFGSICLGVGAVVLGLFIGGLVF